MKNYVHGGDIYGDRRVLFDFSVNTNPLGMPDAARRALIERVDEFSRYPDPESRELLQAIADYENVPAEWIVCGNGAADLIYRLCVAVRPRKALVCAPTFSEYERALLSVGCRVTHHMLLKSSGFEVTDSFINALTPCAGYGSRDTGGVEAGGDYDIIFLCNPNNPTGRLIPRDVLEGVLSAARHTEAVLVIDECFLDFTRGESVKCQLKGIPSLVALKAFTKSFAMAGLRLGYIISANGSLRERVSLCAQSWSVSYPAQTAGIAALSSHSDYMKRACSLIRGERGFLSGALSELGITVFPGEANFLLLYSEKPLYEPLLEKGVLIRSCANFKGLGEMYSRVGVRTREENLKLIGYVKEVLAWQRP